MLKTGGLKFGLILAVLAVTPLLRAQLDQNCTVSILNRNTQVDVNGNWRIDDIPATFGPLIARATCIESGGVQSGQSSPLILTGNSISGFDGLIVLGSAQPIPTSLAITAGSSSLNSPGATTQLTVTATWSAGTSGDVTPSSTGTVYSVTNAAIATVSSEGLVRAISPGTVIVQAANSGAQALISFSISFGSVIDTDGDGIPDSVELANGLNPLDPTDALLDADHDGLTNLDEYRLGTNMLNPDTDGDGIPDLVEIRLGLNPLIPNATTAFQGNVVDGNGAPVAGATVLVLGYFRATTDANGNYLIPGVPSVGPVPVMASANILGIVYQGAVTSGFPGLTGITGIGTIALSQIGNFTVSGIVQDLQGNPIAGAQVAIATFTTGTFNTVTDVNGYYVIANLQGVVSAGAFDPKTGYVGQVTNVINGRGATIVVNIIVGPAGALGGTVYSADGVTPISGAILSLVPSQQAEYVTGASGVARTTSDAQGHYGFSPAPTYPFDFGVIADLVTFHQFYLRNLTVPNGQAVTLNIVYPGLGSVKVTVLDINGNPVPNSSVFIQATGTYSDTEGNFTGSDGTYTSAIVAGPFTATAYSPSSGANAAVSGAVSAGATTNVTVTLPAGATGATVSGTITFGGATPAVGTNAFITQTDQSGNSNTYYLNSPVGADGSYSIAGVQPGGFTLTAQATSGVVMTLTGTVVDGQTPVILNVSFPPGMNVTGNITAADGSAVANALVEVYASSLLFDTIVSADSQGNYSMPGVPAGPFVVYATSFTQYQGQGNVYGSASSPGTTAGSGIAVNVTLPATGTLTGTVYASDGVTPLPYAGPTIENYDNSSGLGYFDIGVPNYYRGAPVQADANGHYSVNGVQAGNVRVSAYQNLQNYSFDAAGVGHGVLTASSQTPASLDVIIGGTANFTESNISQYSLAGADGFQYALDQFLSINQGGTLDGTVNDPFGSTTYLIGAGYTPPHFYVFQDLNGQELATPPEFTYDGLGASRKAFVPASGGFIRFLDTFVNNNSFPLQSPVIVNGVIAPPVSQDGPILPSTDRISIGPAQTQNTYAITDNTVCCFPVLAEVFGGTNAADPVVTTHFASGDRNVSYTWTITLQPGQTVTFMHFLVQRQPGDYAGAADQANALSNLTDPNALLGMSAADKANVVNFSIQ